jgi:hypothetical protein
MFEFEICALLGHYTAQGSSWLQQSTTNLLQATAHRRVVAGYSNQLPTYYRLQHTAEQVEVSQFNSSKLRYIFACIELSNIELSNIELNDTVFLNNIHELFFVTLLQHVHKTSRCSSVNKIKYKP